MDCQAWERCTTKWWNFSGECLTSKKAQTALNKYFCTHPELSSMEECLDDSDIPSRLVTEGSANMSELNVSAAKLVWWLLQMRRTSGYGIGVKSGAMSPHNH